MDVQIWEKTVVAWLNVLSTSTPIRSISQVNDCFLRDIIRKIKSDFDGCPVEFLKNAFPNLINCDSFTLLVSIDCLCIATLLLIYISFSNNAEFEELRETMCTRLDSTTQTNIAEFLMNIQKHEDVFSFSLKAIKEEIFNFVRKYTSVTADGARTPVKTNVSNSSFESPLQGFFQTPKRSESHKQKKGSYSMCGDGDHLKLIKKLTNQLVEEELDKTSLQEQLNTHIQKCNEYENKLRLKIEEINHMKNEWENESKKNENEIQSLKDNILKKFEDEKKLKKELTHLENFVSNLESDLSSSLSQNSKLEYQIKVALEKCAASETQLKEATDFNIQLQKTIDIKEKELAQLREYYVNFYNDEKSIDLSYLDGSFDRSVCPPENMGVVVDKLLREKITENNALKETIEELQKEKNNLLNQVKTLNDRLDQQSSTVSELQYLNKELSAKIENFDSSGTELFRVRGELIKANAEIEKLGKENAHLLERCNCLNIGLKESQQDLVNCRNSKMLLYINFIKLAEDFKAVQQSLHSEVQNIAKLTSDTAEKSLGIMELNNTTEYKYSFENNLSYTQNALSPETNSDFSSDIPDQKLDKLLQNNENQSSEWWESKMSLQKTCGQLKVNLAILKTKIREVEERQKTFLEEKIEYDKHLKESEQKVKEMETAYSSEIKKLKEELVVKENKIKELESIILQSLKMQENLMFEKSSLKKQAPTIRETGKECVHEGGDYANIQTVHPGANITRIIQVAHHEQELNDSLEEVPVCNKTFDIVNLEERNIGNKTFSIKKENLETSVRSRKSNAAWTVSPPSKIPQRLSSEDSVKSQGPKRVHGESWVVPLVPTKSKEKSKKLSGSVIDVRSKTEVSKSESSSNITKSSSLSSIIDIDYSPPSKAESKSSTVTSFFSASNEKSEKGSQVLQGMTGKEIEDGLPAESHIQKVKSLECSAHENFRLVERSDDPLKEIFKRNLHEGDSVKNRPFNEKVSELQKEVAELSQECERLRLALLEAEKKRKKDKETLEKNQEMIRQNITAKYENQLDHLKSEMKQLYNRELAKHKAEQSSLNSELREQNKRYKEHIDELRNQLWDLGEKLLEEQKLKRDLERNYSELKKKFENMMLYKDYDSKSVHGSDIYNHKEPEFHQPLEEGVRLSTTRQIPNATFPTIPTEDEDEVFDNRFLEDMKSGLSKIERPEGRLMELQYRNSLCLPHLKSSYPGETQFHNPGLFKETDLKFGLLPFGQESQSLTDSDHSMTRSLLPENKGKKKEQTSYKRPGPPTPSKNGGRLSLQGGGDVRLTPRNVLRELNDQNERNKGTPNPLKVLLSAKSIKSVGKDENSGPVTPRKKMKFFRKPFGARDH